MSRVPELRPNRLTQALDRLRAEGRVILDLTESNPTRAEFEYPPDLLLTLADSRALRYDPHPFGLPDARRAVAAAYLRRGLTIDPGRVALTASTSEAYSLLFKILCEPGDDVLVPRPSYPLFEHLARLDSIVARSYDLDYHGRWAVDRASLESAFTTTTRAVIAVHPNNPTGSFLTKEDLQWLDAECAARNVVLIADEVFADYELAPGTASAGGRMLTRHDALVFALGGLSKSIGLPQAKLAWMVAAGPEARIDWALARLEFACDAYLSVSTPVQIAVGDLLTRGEVIRSQILDRIRLNYRYLSERAGETPSCQVLNSDAGWSAVVQVPTFVSEDDLVVDLLTNDGVLVHPGFLFDFPCESFLIVSLLLPPQMFQEGVGRLFRHFDCTAQRK